MVDCWCFNLNGCLHYKLSILIPKCYDIIFYMLTLNSNLHFFWPPLPFKIILESSKYDHSFLCIWWNWHKLQHASLMWMYPKGCIYGSKNCGKERSLCMIEIKIFLLHSFFCNLKVGKCKPQETHLHSKSSAHRHLAKSCSHPLLRRLWQLQQHWKQRSPKEKESGLRLVSSTSTSNSYGELSGANWKQGLRRLILKDCQLLYCPPRIKTWHNPSIKIQPYPGKT